MRKLIVLAVTLLPLITFSQEKTGWSRTYDRGGAESGRLVVECDDGNLVVLGHTYLSENRNSRIWLVKVDREGDTIWTKIYGNVEDTTRWRGSHIIENSDKGYAMVGYNNANVLGENVIWLLLLDKEFDTLWTRTYRNGEGAWGRFIQQTGDGGYLLVGQYSITNLDGEDEDYIWVIKIDSMGDTLSTLTYRGDDYYNLIGACDAHDGGIMLMAGLADQPWKCFIHISEDGEELEMEDFITWSVEVYGICDFQKGNDAYVMTGWAYSDGGTGPGLWVSAVEVYGSMDEIWSTVLWGENGEGGCGHSIRTAIDGGYIITGHPWALMKLGGWKRDYYDGDPYRGGLYFALSTTDSGYIATGSKDDDLWLLKVDANGDTLASITENPAAPSNWYVSNPIGRTVSLQYSNSPTGFHASVFDASGRAVDEIQSNLTQGTLTWGQGQNPGVYFIRPSTGVRPPARVVIVR